MYINGKSKTLSTIYYTCGRNIGLRAYYYNTYLSTIIHGVLVSSFRSLCLGRRGIF